VSILPVRLPKFWNGQWIACLFYYVFLTFGPYGWFGQTPSLLGKGCNIEMSSVIISQVTETMALKSGKKSRPAQAGCLTIKT